MANEVLTVLAGIVVIFAAGYFFRMLFHERAL